MTKKTDEKVENKEVVETKVAPEEPKAEPKAEPKEPVQAEKSVEELADEVDRGVHGSGRERMITLGARYTEVQAEVNRRYKESIKL